MARHKIVGNELLQMSAEEEAVYDATAKAFADDLPNRQISEIRGLRNAKLANTDYLALSDVPLTDEMKSYRQGLRDIPQNNTTKAEYDLILARDENGQLTHAVWSKP
tara:strand:- start:41 stop:361 length:321 start_codon:yes stop_codon:yes gene_type:complete